MNIREAVLFGTTGHALSLYELAQSTLISPPDVVAFIDDYIGDRGVEIHGRPVVSFERWRKEFIDRPVVLTSGYPSTRETLVRRIEAAGGFCRGLVGGVLHATHGEGVISGCITSISPSVVIGSYVHVYSHVTVGPHSRIGDFVTIAQGVIVGANVTIEASSFIGCGATIAPRGSDGLKIGRSVHIHAGTVIRDDVPDNAVLVGDPPFDPRLSARRERRGSPAATSPERPR